MLCGFLTGAAAAGSSSTLVIKDDDRTLTLATWEMAVHLATSLVFLSYIVTIATFHGFVIAGGFSDMVGDTYGTDDSSLRRHRHNLLVRWMGVSATDPFHTIAFMLCIVLLLLFALHLWQIARTFARLSRGNLTAVAELHEEDKRRWIALREQASGLPGVGGCLARLMGVHLTWLEPHHGRFGLHGELHMTFKFALEAASAVLQFTALYKLSHTPFSNKGALLLFATAIMLNCVVASGLRVYGKRRDVEICSMLVFDCVYGVVLQLVILWPLFAYIWPDASMLCEGGAKLVNNMADAEGITLIETNSAEITSVLAASEQFNTADLFIFLQRFMPLASAWMLVDDLHLRYAARSHELHRRASVRRTASQVLPTAAGPAAASTSSSSAKEAGGGARKTTLKGAAAKVLAARGPTLARLVGVATELAESRNAFAVRFEAAARKGERVAAALLVVFGIAAFAATVAAVGKDNSACKCDHLRDETIEGGEQIFAYPLFYSGCACMTYTANCADAGAGAGAAKQCSAPFTEAAKAAAAAGGGPPGTALGASDRATLAESAPFLVRVELPDCDLPVAILQNTISDRARRTAQHGSEAHSC